MVRYPHTLTVTFRADGTYDPTGDYTPGATSTYEIEGRAEANGAGKMIALEGGAQIVYNFMFYCEDQHFELPYNADATLSTGWSGTVKRMANNQKGTMIWL